MKLLDNLFIPQSLNDVDGGFTARMLCNPSHFIYQAHFPGNPITPGVCVIQLASELLEQKMNHPLWLKRVKSVKFLNSIIPASGKEIVYSFDGLTETETGCTVQVVVSEAAYINAKMSMEFSYESL